MWTIALAVYCVVALLLLGALIGNISDQTNVRDFSAMLSAVVFWPAAVLIAVIIMAWRVPFKSSRHIRRNIRDRRLLNEFNRFIKNKENVEYDSVLDRN